ncbi:ferritin-like domain-containing protein [Salinisphaera orenii]|uniref:Uncharacterized protein n=1 Tax=Salinisphaera orenii YIM 95161 TaxID=1051139 RepID=A0A423Q669_9GAMM|nr:DUF892 family protein [Salinisphaera halophila]ROO35177.1 hypothetical protein SAHL_02695 [Salinisphaera halophila YIM 95161]
MSVTTPRERLIEWLKEAHAMARHGETMLSARADDLRSYPQLAERLAAHATQTQAQATRIADCLDELGEDTSSVRDLASRLSAAGHSLGTRVAGEQAVQAHAASLAFEHYEIANYRALVAAAQAADAPAVKSLCEAILTEQRTMADWLESHLDATTAAFLEHG